MAGDPLNTPLMAASNFIVDPTATDGRVYSRNEGTTQWEAFESAIGQLEGGPAVSFASGMAAISAILNLLEPGASVVAPADCYQGVTAILDQRAKSHGWNVRIIATTDTPAWLEAIDGQPDLLWIESPSNPMLEVADVPSLCSYAAERGVVAAVDNTFATPLLQNPLQHGATYAVHSATKFIGGHSDLLGGVVACASSAAADELRLRRSLGGATMGALEAFLALRGLRTLPVRLARSQETAGILAERLHQHAGVVRVAYPGLSKDPGAELAARTMSGPGAVLSFETIGDPSRLDVALSRLSIIHNATSLGGVESTIERRHRLPGQEMIPPTLLRLSVGCEHPDDLWQDLTGVLDALH